MAEPADDRTGAPLRELAGQAVLAAVGAAALTRERAEAIVEDLVRRGTLSHADARGLADELVESSRPGSSGLTARAGAALGGVFRELGLVMEADLAELELRVAQLEHRLSLLERGSGRDRPARRRPYTARMRARPAVRQLGRLSEIGQVAARHGFGYLLETRRPFRWRRAAEADGPSRGQRLRELLDELGPTFVKFGQLLSTRPDLVPPDIVAELRALQDDVRPFPFAEVEATLERELGLTVERLFLELDREPVAAASIGQVHRAVLPNGERVAVKVQRPQAPRQIEADLELLYQAARIVQPAGQGAPIHRHRRDRRRVRALDPPGARLPRRGA